VEAGIHDARIGYVVRVYHHHGILAKAIRLSHGVDAPRVRSAGQEKALRHAIPERLIELAPHLEFVLDDLVQPARSECWLLRRGEPAEIGEPACVEGEPAHEARRQWFAAGEGEVL